MNKSLLVICFTSLVVFTTSSQAKIYKWVDSNGVTHYSSMPPAKKNAKSKAKDIEDKIRSAAGKFHPPAAEKKTSAQTKPSNANDGNENDGSKNELSPPNKKLVDYCKSQQRNLENLKKNFRNVWVDKDGKRTTLDQKQRQEKVDNIKKTLNKTCKEVI